MNTLDADLEDYCWLTSQRGEAWLARATGDNRELPALASSLRKDLSPNRAHLVLEQLELRRRARDKFFLAERMLFTRKGLEQATGDVPARYKASRFATDGRYLDLCCGIGGDLLALAERGAATGIDRDPVAALFATYNCRALGCRPAIVHSGEAEAADVSDFEAWHIDPDRRVTGRRTVRVDQGEPGIETLDRLLDKSDAAAIKLAPAAEAPLHWLPGTELEWIGERGECRQQVAWFGPLAQHAGSRSATVLSDHGESRTIVGTGKEELTWAEQVARYVFEPQAAVLAARLAGQVAADYELACLADCGGYLTGDKLVSDPALAAFEVLDVLPFDIRRLKAWLRERGVGHVEIKKRGLEVDPAALQKRLSAQGENRAAVLLTKLGTRRLAILGRRPTAAE